MLLDGTDCCFVTYQVPDRFKFFETTQKPLMIRVVDSHTEGEPTRVVIAGGPEFKSTSFAERWEEFQANHDDFRRTVILEPRGYEAMVGALLVEPDAEDCAAGIFFFNNRGYLDMCGHGTIGVAATMAHLKRLPLGKSKFQTPAGIIDVDLLTANEVAITNVGSYLLHADVAVEVPDHGELTGDIAYGGNWFFNVQSPLEISLANGNQLLALAEAIRSSLLKMEFDSVDTSRIDHIQFFSPDYSNGHSDNFVICPGGQFDRSPCGTGSSSLLACLASRDQLAAGETWQQTSLTGGQFSATYQIGETKTGAGTVSNPVIPTITGRAFVCSEANLIQNPADPYRLGNEIKWGQA